MMEFWPFGLIEISVLLGLIAGVIVVVILIRGMTGRRAKGSGAGADTVQTEGQSFDDRLRRLETLRRDGIVSNGEYRRKRQEIGRAHV